LNLRSERHLYSADYIRALASLAVALFHLGGKVLPVLKWGWLGVELFFVLSGFIICRAMPKGYRLAMSGKFILRRIVRIEPAYLISLLLLIALNYVMIARYSPDPVQMLLHIGYLNGFFNRPFLSPVYWTLGVEFQYYLFIAFFFPLLSGFAGKWFILVLTLLPVFLPMPGNTLGGLFPFFGLGIYCYLYSSAKLPMVQFLLFTAACVACGIRHSGVVPALAGLAGVLLLLLPLKSNRLVTFFSKISFSLYLTHDSVGSWLVIFLGTHFPRTIFFKGTIFLIGVAVSIAFASLFFYCVERPFLNWSKRIKYST